MSAPADGRGGGAERRAAGRSKAPAAKSNMGYVRVDRQLLDWEWYKDQNTFRVFMHLILKANWKEGRFQGVEVPRGSLITSYANLASELGLTVRNVRTAIEHLKMTGEVTSTKHAKFSLFTVKNYDLYQSDDKQVTSNRQASDKQSTTIEKGKKERNKKDDLKHNVVQPENGKESIWSAEDVQFFVFDESMLESDDADQEEVGYIDFPEEETKDFPGKPVGEVIDHLNQMTGKKFRKNSKEIRKHILRKMDEGYTLDDFKNVINKKTAAWKGTKMEQFLRPSTLFGDHFEEYLNEREVGVVNELPPGGSSRQGTRFSNFTQRQQDFEDLEKKLLGL